MALRPDEFTFISDLLKKRSGLALTVDKEYLLESRLLPIARGQSCATLSDFITLLKTKPTEALLAEVTDSMTTNESMFFRDTKPFEQLRRVILPALKESGPARKMRIWSAACSTGQEPYSILITLMEEAAKMPGWQWELVGTDISPRVLEKARQGLYTQFEVQRGLGIQHLLKYFKQLPDNNWQAQDVLRNQATYRPFNLLDDYSLLSKFDIIFCRNVLIYFDDAGKTKVLEKLAASLNPKGFLVLGASETIIGLTSKLKPLDNERGLFVAT